MKFIVFREFDPENIEKYEEKADNGFKNRNKTQSDISVLCVSKTGLQ